ncbi:MAG: cytochrome C oxidase subunit IV family protein [Gemmatimonadales bacterium]
MAASDNHPNYIMVWLGLAVLTAVEIGVAFLPWNKTIVIVLLVFLAVWKALMVALYFMHLKYEKFPLRILAVAPLPLAVILVVAVITEFRW